MTQRSEGTGGPPGPPSTRRTIRTTQIASPHILTMGAHRVLRWPKSCALTQWSRASTTRSSSSSAARPRREQLETWLDRQTMGGDGGA